MGKDKTTTGTDMRSTSENTQKAEATGQEEELNRLNLEAIQAAQSGLTGVQGSGLDLVQNLLSGQELPGYLSGLPGGISPELTQEIARESVADIQPQFQQLGLLDSGVNASISARTAGDVRQRAAEFNVNNLQNLLNMALAGSGQVQAPILGQNAQLNQSLAGLRTLTGTGLNTQSGTVTSKAMNPFLKSFQTSFGQGLGTGASAGIFGAGQGGGQGGSGGAMQAAMMAAGGGCLPADTPIELENGSAIPVEQLLPDQIVKGGRIISVQRVRRPKDHKFYRHVANTGDVIMSYDHPIEDVLLDRIPVEHQSDFTYDILTESGWYMINGVKVISTMANRLQEVE